MKRAHPDPVVALRGAHRPPLERMLQIHQAIQSGSYPNATTLAAELEVCTKTINRDTDFMRDRLGLPMEYDGTRCGYHYTQPVSSFPTLQITTQFPGASPNTIASLITTPLEQQFGQLSKRKKESPNPASTITVAAPSFSSPFIRI